jgi:hypothetical protein
MYGQKLLILFLYCSGIFLTACEIKLDSNIVDANDYLKADPIPVDVYEKGDNKQFLNPFNFDHTEYGKLILISIKDHPNIKTVELVVQYDNKGAFFIVYDHDGKADIYINPYLTVNKKYLEPNPDWKIVGEQDFKYVFENTTNGITLSVDISINDNQQIIINLNENRIPESKYSFLAAIGAELSDVKRFPFVYLREAGFVTVEGTDVSFEINGKKMELSKVPFKIEGQKSYRAPYSFNPLPFFWNEEQDDYLFPEIITDTKSYQKGNADYIFADNDGYNEIQKVIYKTKGHTASYRFAPSFPDIVSLKSGVNVNGKFCLGVDEIEGIVCGTYSVKKSNQEIDIHIAPEFCWQPMPGKDWVSAYHYQAKITPLDEKKYKIKSEWVVE